MQVKLNKSSVLSAPAGIHGFADCRWLKLRVSPGGRRTWLYLRKDRGKYVKHAIGLADVMSPQEALEKCLQMAGKKDTKAKAPTLGEIMQQWIDAGTRGPKMKRHQLYYVEVLGGLVRRRLDGITNGDAEAWHAEATKARGTTSANNALRAAKAAVNWALAKRIATGENPFARVKPNKTETRSRFLHGEELERFRTEMAALSPVKQGNFRDFLGILMHTGQRMGNICAMEWAEVDLGRREWTIPAGKYKSRRSHTVPLVAAVVEILTRRRKSHPGRWVFPSNSVEGHSLSFICQLRRLCQRAGINDLTQHDLRRTVASSLINDGVPLQTVMAILGHTSAQTSLIYARIADQSKRAALERL